LRPADAAEKAGRCGSAEMHHSHDQKPHKQTSVSDLVAFRADFTPDMRYAGFISYHHIDFMR
jgi:hypothetical protein